MFQLINLCFKFMYLALFARVILSWIPNMSYHPAIEFIYTVTDPILKPFQNLMPRGMGIDFSPILAFLALEVAQNVLLNILF